MERCVFVLRSLHTARQHAVHAERDTFLLRDADMHRTYLLRQRGWLAGWLGGWVSVTRRYCIKTAKPILKLFDQLVTTSF